MMGSTHYLSGALVGLIASQVDPTMLLPLVVTGMVAAAVPDLDILWEHRKTLHRPFQYTVSLLIVAGLYAAVAGRPLLFATVGLGALAVHSVSEILSQGKTMNPALHRSERCVYNRLTGRWVAPRNLVNVASPRDLALTYLLAVPFLVSGNSYLHMIALALAAVGTLQVAIHEPLTREVLEEHDRFSEWLQLRLGIGPEVAMRKD